MYLGGGGALDRGRRQQPSVRGAEARGQYDTTNLSSSDHSKQLYTTYIYIIHQTLDFSNNVLHTIQIHILQNNGQK